MVGDLLDLLVALGGHGDDHRAAGLALLQVAHRLVVHGALGGDGDNREALIDERDGAVLHLAGSVCLRVQVADLLELERTLVADGRAHAAAHEERRLRVFARERRLVDGHLLGVQDVLDLLGGVAQLAEEHAHLTGRQFALHLGEQHGEQRERDHLADEALGGGHRDLLVGLGVDDAVGLARHGAAHHVRDAEDLGALDARVADGGEGVGRLAGLAHGYHERGRRDDGVAVAELARGLHLGGDARPALDKVFGDESSMEARAAGNHVHAVHQVQLLVGEAQFVDVELASAGHAAHERVAHHARLLANLLEHEVGVAGLLGHIHVPVHVRDLGFDNVALGIGVLDGIRRELGELAVLEHHHVTRGVDEGDDVGRHVAAVLATPDDDGVVLARHGDGAWLVRAHRGEAVGAHHVGAGIAHGGHEVVGGRLAGHLVALVGFLDEVGEDLGIGVALEHVAAALELLAQLGEVLDDAVVDHGDLAVAARVRVSVLDRGAPVRGPAGVADAAGSGEILARGQLGLEALHLSHAADDVELDGAVLSVVLQRHARGIVAAILHALQPGDEDLRRLIRTGVTNNAAHRVAP